MNEFYELKISDAYAWVRHSDEDSIYFTKEKISNVTPEFFNSCYF